MDPKIAHQIQHQLQLDFVLTMDVMHFGNLQLIALNQS
jgi:hypothetical protein